jgi:hypothetical protein
MSQQRWFPVYSTVHRLVATGGLALLLSLSVLSSGCDQKATQIPPDTTPIYPAPTKKAGMTWYKDVQPIIAVSCQGCHAPGGIAPFPLPKPGGRPPGSASKPCLRVSNSHGSSTAWRWSCAPLVTGRFSVVAVTMEKL